MTALEYVKPQPAFDEPGIYEALVVGSAKWTNGRSAAGVSIRPFGQPQKSHLDRKPSLGCNSDSWRADLGGIRAAVSLTPENSRLIIYTANKEAADRADRLFNGDRSALFKANGKPIVNAECLKEADEDRRNRNIAVHVEYSPKNEFSRAERQELLNGNRRVMTN